MEEVLVFSFLLRKRKMQSVGSLGVRLEVGSSCEQGL